MFAIALGNSALMLVCARTRHGAGTQWGDKTYMNGKRLESPISQIVFTAYIPQAFGLSP